MADLINPTISPIFPQPNSKNNALDSRISFRIKDTIESGSGIDLTSVYVTVNGQYAYYQGTLQSGFDGYYVQDPDQNDYYFEVQRDAYYSALESVNVAVSARDLSGNYSATNVFSFIALDNVPPSIVDITPPNQAGQIGSDQVISFKIRTTPKEVEINLSSLVVQLGGLLLDGYGAPILDGYGDPTKQTIIEPDTTGQLSYDQRVVSILKEADNLGYKIVITPLIPLPLSSKITLDIYVEDTAGNIATASSFFTTQDDKAPILLNPMPAPSSIANSIASVISFTLSDKQGAYSGSGLDLSTLQVKVDDKFAIKNGFAQTGFSVSITNNYGVNGVDVIIAPDNLLNPHKTINVAMIISDRNLNVLSTNYFFTTQDVTPPAIMFITPLVGSTGVATNTSLIIDFQSEVAVEELDVGSISVIVDGSPAFVGNSFQPGFSGLAIATTKTTLTLTITKDVPFSLGQTVSVVVQGGDVFGNIQTALNSFTITSTTALTSQVFPLPGIYDTKSFDVNFQDVGSYLDLTLSTFAGASIVYTLDGSDPSIDQSFVPQGTTQLYISPIRVLTNSPVILRFFAFNSSTNEIESKINNGVYLFSGCPEKDIFEDSSLQSGLEYTNKVSLKNLLLQDGNLSAATGIGVANYIHDLGRQSFVDSLDFQKTGIVKFRTKVVDNLSDLPITQWSNTIYDVVTNQELGYFDGYDVAVSTIGEDLRFEGRSQQIEFFTDDAYAKVKDTLLESFTVSADMRLTVDKNESTGAKSYIKIEDDNYTIEVQQFFSKNQFQEVDNAFFGETANITFGWQDAYQTLTDGYKGFVTLTNPPEIQTQDIEFLFSTTQKIVDGYLLSDDLIDIFDLKSSTPSVYNQFPYSSNDGYDAYLYSSALVSSVRYRRQLASARTHFTLPVLGVPLDASIATLNSQNLDTTLDQFVPAEKNDIFETTLFFESGDYNYRFHVEYWDGYQVLTREVGNPYTLITKQDLSAVQFADILRVGSNSYSISSVKRLQAGDFAIELLSDFPLEQVDIPIWSIVRNQSTILSSIERIEVKNPTNSSIGQDAQGVLANLVIFDRADINFTYISSNAIKVSLIGTFNNFNADANILIEGLDPAEIYKIFDKETSTTYRNSYQDFHKFTVTPELPLIVDRVRFQTSTTDAYQRTRLLLDDTPVARSNYKAFKQDQNPHAYLNATDLYSSQSDGYVEWKFQNYPNNPNRAYRSSIGLLTRMDSFAGLSREHVDFEIFTLPDLPVFTSDYFLSADKQNLYRQDSSGFASVGNDVSFIYNKEIHLPAIKKPLKILNQGIVKNFIASKIITAGVETNSIYIDKPYLLQAGDKVLTTDGVTYLQATVLDILSTRDGLIQCDGPVHTQGLLVKDYFIEEDENNFYVKLEVPNFTIAYVGSIVDVQTTLTTTKIRLKNVLDLNPATWLGGKLTYPLLDGVGRIIDVGTETKQVGSQVIPIIFVVIDRVLESTSTYPTLGATIEVFNSSKIVTDYVFNKTSQTGICLNQSGLCDSFAQVTYEANILSYQIPNEMQKLDGYSLDQVNIDVSSTLANVALSEIDSFKINFFNGVDGQAPSSVQFSINGISRQIPLSEADIIDGYAESLYNPMISSTGQIVEFVVTPEALFDGYDGYLSQRLDSARVTFSGQDTFYIGELRAVVKSTITDSRCRILLNNEELYLSALPTSSDTSNYNIVVDRGSVLVYFNGDLVLTRPILLLNPKVSFGASPKSLDDYLVVDFKRLMIDQYYTISPAKIQQIGRYIEIEGTIVSL